MRRWGDLLVLLVDGAHQGSSWRQYLVDEDKDGFLRLELDTLSDDIYKLVREVDELAVSVKFKHSSSVEQPLACLQNLLVQPSNPQERDTSSCRWQEYLSCLLSHR